MPVSIQLGNRFRRNATTLPRTSRCSVRSSTELGRKETERRRRAAPAGPAKSHDETAPGRRPLRGVAGTAHVLTPRTLRPAFGRFAGKQNPCSRMVQIVNGPRPARSMLWSNLRGPGTKVRRPAQCRTHHSAMLPDRERVVKQENRRTLPLVKCSTIRKNINNSCWSEPLAPRTPTMRKKSKPTRLQCHICKHETEHTLRLSDRNEGKFSLEDDYEGQQSGWWNVVSDVFQCLGCRELAIRRTENHSEADFPDSQFFPPRQAEKTLLPPDWADLLPQGIELLLKEVYAAIQGAELPTCRDGASGADGRVDDQHIG